MIHVGFLIFPRFSNHCLANALEPLRATNEILRKNVFSWAIYTIDGETVASSSAFDVAPNSAIGIASGGDLLCVLPSYDPALLAGPGTKSALRTAEPKFETVAGMDTGSWLLAHAGLLTNRSATIHAAEFQSFSEQFPETHAVTDRVTRSGKYWSCGGASSAFDLIITFIQERFGADVAMDVSAYFLMNSPRADNIDQFTGSTIVYSASRIMRSHLETPLPIPDIASQLGLHPRKLERAFQTHLSRSPKSEYNRIRLGAARDMVLGSRHSLLEIALRCGYSNGASMTRAFKTQFGTVPSELRK